jgi:hypothetical protein
VHRRRRSPCRPLTEAAIPARYDGIENGLPLQQLPQQVATATDDWIIDMGPAQAPNTLSELTPSC